MNNAFKVSGRLLEEAFFRKHDEELIRRMKEAETKEAHRKTLTAVSGITDAGVLDRLIAHDIHPGAMAAFALLPIIEVAWADGHVHPDELSALLHAAETSGIPKDSVAFTLISHWLHRRPDPKLLGLWKDYVHALCATLQAREIKAIRESILGHARAIANAAGGFLGIGKVSAKERAVLGDLEKAFKTAPRKASE